MDNVVYYKNGTILKRYTGNDSVYHVNPSVKEIDIGAFKDNQSIEELYLPDSVTDISSESFLNCINLKKIRLSNNLIYIGIDAFKNCKKLESVVIPKSVNRIRDFAFCNCESLKEIKILNNIIDIGQCVFTGCKNLPDILYSDDKSALIYYNHDKRHDVCFEIPDHVKIISSHAFVSCRDLSMIKMGNNVKYIGNHTFADCLDLVSIKLSNNIKKLHKYTFYKCVELEELNIPSKLEEIEPWVFYKCYKLINKIELPKTVKKIRDYDVFFKGDDMGVFVIDKRYDIVYEDLDFYKNLKYVKINDIITKKCGDTWKVL